MENQLIKDIEAAIDAVLDNGKDYGIEFSQSDILALFAQHAVLIAAELASGK